MIKKLNLFVGLMALFMLISCGRNRDTIKPDNTDNTTDLKYSETLIKYHNAEETITNVVNVNDNSLKKEKNHSIIIHPLLIRLSKIMIKI